MRALLTLFFLLPLPLSLNAQTVPTLAWTFLRSQPRASEHFTQGLVYAESQLFESTGKYEHSAVFAYHATTLQETHRRPLANNVFGEGLTYLHGKLYQASWRSHVIFVYDTQLRLLKTLPLRGEGWGLTTNGSALILSDGSNQLHFLDPDTGALQRTLTVNDHSDTLWSQLNELEWVDGHILANIWHSNNVLLIDSNDGRVKGRYDFSRLSETISQQMQHRTPEDVLNGMAWRTSDRTLLVTGKNWPLWFFVQLTMPESH